jgi:hypothetical protein
VSTPLKQPHQTGWSPVTVPAAVPQAAAGHQEARMIPIATVLVLFVMFAAMVWAIADA